MMKNASLLLGILVFVCSCEQKSLTEKSSEWVKQYHVIPCDRWVYDIVWFDDHFIAHTGGSSFIALHRTDFQRDTAFETLLGKQNGKLMTSFSGDSLFAVENDQQYWWDKNSRKWSAAGRYEEPECYPLFEDTDYLVTGICHGEFWGSIAFFNKKTGKTHGVPMTCPVQVEKKEGTFYIVSYLDHLGSASSVTLVSNPEEMPEYPDCVAVYNTAAGIERRIMSYYFKQGQKILPEDSLKYAGIRRGTVVLMPITLSDLASSCLLFKNDQPYLIYRDTANQIGRLETGTLIVADRIAGSEIWPYGTVTVRDSAHFLTFADWDTRGFIFVKNDTIHIAVFKPK